MLMIRSLDKVNELTLGVTSIVLPGTIDVVFGVSQELHPMGNPPSHTRNGKKHGEHVSRETHCSVDEATVEIDVGVKLATHTEYPKNYK